MITAKPIQAYFFIMAQNEAFQLMVDVMKDTVIVADSQEDETGDPISSTATVEGRKLAMLIDAAAGAIGYRIKDELKREKISVEIGDRILEVLQGIDGELAVLNVSTELLCFLPECYMVLR